MPRVNAAQRPYDCPMPELPEVESIVRRFRARLDGRRIVDFISHWPKQCSPDADTVRRRVQGRRIARLWRRAKFVVMDLCDTKPAGHLLIHLRMSGRFEWSADCDEGPAHVRAELAMSGGDRLLFCDARKFGRILFTDRLAELEGRLGPEPLDAGFTRQALTDLLRRRSRQLKPLLLDQSVLAGLGNIYTDEALFHAGLHPLSRSDELRDPQIAALRRAIRFVLRKGIRLNGATIDWIYPGGEMQRHFSVYGRTGEPCVRCRTPIAALRVGQRGTHVCPRCQALRSARRTGAAGRS